jgi:hypothetical protein
LGCDLRALPRARDAWLTVAYEPALTISEPISDATPPEIPEPGDTRYHGEKLDLKGRDLGAYLVDVQRTRQLGPRVVLHLRGQGKLKTTPIRLKNTSLTLYFEPPATKDDPPLVLRLAEAGPAALIELEGGSLEVIGGHLEVSDIPGPRVPHVIKVQGGDVRLFRTRVEGPQQAVPDLYSSLIHLTGSGDVTSDKVFSCTANESILVSGRVGVDLQGIGTRLMLRQTLLVAGTDAVRLRLNGCKGRANVQCLLENVTIAAQHTVLRLADAPEAGVPSDPAFFLTRNCAFLNPFRGAAAGLLLYEEEALQRGLLVVQGERDTFDQRLFFPAARVGQLPSRPTGLADWNRSWGSRGVRDTRPNLPGLLLFKPPRWDLDQLILPADRGANLAVLGIKKPRP